MKNYAMLAYYIISTIMSVLSATLSKIALRLSCAVNVSTLIFYNGFAYSLIAIVYGVYTKKNFLSVDHKDNHLPILLAILSTLFYALYMLSIKLLPLSIMGVLIHTFPFFTIILNIFVGNRNINAPIILSSIICFIGIICLNFNTGSDYGFQFSIANMLIYLIPIMSAMFAGLIYFMTYRIMQRKIEPSLVCFCSGTCAATIAAFSSFLSAKDEPYCSPSEGILKPIALIGTSSICYGLSNLVYFTCAKYITDTKLAVLSYIAILYYFAVDILWFSRIPSLNEVIGCILILSGISWAIKSS